MRAPRALNTTRNKEAGKWPLRSTLALKSTRFVSISCNQTGNLGSFNQGEHSDFGQIQLLLIRRMGASCCPADGVSHQEILLEDMGQQLILSFQMEDKEKHHLLIPEWQLRHLTTFGKSGYKTGLVPLLRTFVVMVKVTVDHLHWWNVRNHLRLPPVIPKWLVLKAEGPVTCISVTRLQFTFCSGLFS